MLIGAMNHPRHEVLAELAWIAEMGLGFVDLTLEPPASASWAVDPKAIRAGLAEHALDVIGHTPYYLPIASPVEELRQAAVAELRRCLRVFAEVGAPWMNIHPDPHAPMHDRAFVVARNLESLAELLPEAQRLGVGLMVENIPEGFNNVAQLAELLEPMPELGLHLDIGHCNLRVPANTAPELIGTYGKRLRHVHLHDNKGDADQHLPLGAGTLDYHAAVRSLQAARYDGMITLEVFSPDPSYLAHSRDLLRQAWAGGGDGGCEMSDGRCENKR